MECVCGWIFLRYQRREMQKSAGLTHLCQLYTSLSCNLPATPHTYTHMHVCTHKHTHRMLLQAWIKYSERTLHIVRIKIHKYGITNKLQFVKVSL